MQVFRSLLDREKGKEHSIQEAVLAKQKRLRFSERETRNIGEALTIAQIVAQQTQAELKYHISELVTLALAAVYDEPYEFTVNFVIKRNKTEAEIKFLKNGIEMDPMQESGGGPINVATLALQVSLWKIQKPKSINTFVLDEPGRFVSRDLQPRFGEMLQMISQELGIQFILVTHLDALEAAADKLFKVSQKKGICSVVES